MGVLMMFVVLLAGLFGLTVAFTQEISKHFIGPSQNNQLSTGTIAHTEALLGGTAKLHCDLSTPNDNVELVVWYKGEHTPIYSYDVRGQNKPNAKHWTDTLLQYRGFFHIFNHSSILVINNVVESDEGEYRCRIDYLKSPTKNHRCHLTVIVPPTELKIIDEKGKKVGEVAGPYEEGIDLNLICVVTGGDPKPSITWYQENTLLHSTEIIKKDRESNIQLAQLTIRNLQKSHQHATFSCQAMNHNISQPPSVKTTLDIYFRPVSTEILNSKNPFSADRKYEIPCQTFGSRPPAKITWLLDGKELITSKHNITISNSTFSTLIYTPTREDNLRTLTCRATNTKMNNGIVEASLNLNVYYLPIVNLSLSPHLNPKDIEEGDDVYFECKVNANPKAYKVVWKHNKQLMQPNPKTGIIMGTEALALQTVTRNQAGNYTCVASNVEGDGDSNVVHLKIMYKPKCRKNQKWIYGVGRHEKAKIFCEVDAYPPPDKFSWSFNNSAETIEVPQTRYNSEEYRFSSTLTYTPVSELDYGTVLCRATNMAGRQQEPCIFHIIAAGKPDPLHNCSIVNRTNDSLEVECSEGFDGGQPQYFLLEVYDGKTGTIQANVSSKFPLFIVSGLDPGKELKMVIYAANGKGRSEPVLLEGFTLKTAEKQTVLSLGTRDQIEIAPVLGILVGLVTALLVVTVIILGALKIRQARREDSNRSLRPRFLAVKDKVMLPLRSESEDLFEKDDKNPDVVPSNKDSDYQLGSAVQTPGLNNSVVSVQSNPSNDPVSTQSTMHNNITPLAEAYMARTMNFVSPNTSNNEVVYAELQLARPNSLDPIQNGGGQKQNQQPYATLRKRDESTIYTKIDHARRPPPPIPNNNRTSPIISPVTAIFPTSKPGLYHREVVTVRTPLMGCQQESCV
ncbi:hypothetical protein ABEB36_003251 [Hypothenemus hampei]|uniref:Uncharacterized protein n=1 Tax=Hypothenemus hampei TaxID=57062 RepID=A0ABD1F8Y0_HYPHA